MGYFDDVVDVKKDLTQEATDMDRFAGNAFWYSIGSLAMLIWGIILCAIFHFEVIYCGIPFIFSISFSMVAVIYGLKAQRSASIIRQKNPLKSVAIAYGLLWMLLSILILSFNTYQSVMIIISNI